MVAQPAASKSVVSRGASIRPPGGTLDPATFGASDRPLFVHNQPPNWLCEGRLRKTVGSGGAALEVVHFEVTLSGRSRMTRDTVASIAITRRFRYDPDTRHFRSAVGLTPHRRLALATISLGIDWFIFHTLCAAGDPLMTAESAG